jgi:hypothetical protein
VIRQQILDSFDDSDTEAADLKNMDRLYSVEDMIAAATFETDVSVLAGSKILLETGDGPDYADSFKRKLFVRMQQFV